MPLEHIAARSDRDHDARPHLRAELAPQVLGHGLRAALREIEQQLAPLPKDPTQQAWHGENGVTVRDGLEYLFAQPLRPQERALLLAGRAEVASATGVRDQIACPTRVAPSPGEAALDEPTCEEGPQHPLDHGTQRAVHPGEALLVQAQKRLEVLLDQTEQRRVPSPARPVDATGDLHTSRPAGGRAPGESRRGRLPLEARLGGREEASTAGGSGRVRRPRTSGLTPASAIIPRSARATSIRGWWRAEGPHLYAKARQIVITADAGGSNGSRLRLWKWELQRFADETGRSLSVCHFPPGTSKWNKVEHRLFSFISSNWRGEPLRDYETIVNLDRSDDHGEGTEGHLPSRPPKVSYRASDLRRRD